MTDVKICGISNADDYQICRAAGARWIGMVNYPGSSRHLDCTALAALTAAIDQLPAEKPSNKMAAGPQRVLLTVDQHTDQLAPLVRAARPDLLQLHGRETVDEAAAIKAAFGLPIIKMVPVASGADIAACATWDGVADWLIFDAKTEQGTQPGGTGHSFDWTLLSSYHGRTPWMLAGGLTASTVRRAVEISGAGAVDVSSGVESKPGKKDENKIHAFISAAQIG